MGIFSKRDFEFYIKKAHEALSSHQPERAASLAYDAVSSDPDGVKKLETLTWDVLDLEHIMSPKMILYSTALTSISPQCCVGWIASASAAIQCGNWETFLTDFARAEERIHRGRCTSWDRYKNGTFHLFFLFEKYWTTRFDLDMEYGMTRRCWEELAKVAEYFEVLLQRVVESSNYVPVEQSEWKYLAAKGKHYPKPFSLWECEIMKKLR